MTASAVIAVVAVCLRIYNAGAYPPLADWDAAGHAVNIVDLLEGNWPNPRSWSGSHPPLYHGLGAALWVLLPEAVPIHVALRLLAASAWIGTVALVWRALRKLVSHVDAAVVAVVLLGVPGFVIASAMMTNDTLCAFFITAALARLIAVRREVMLTVVHGATTGALVGLAAVTKAQGLATVAVAAAWYAWRGRRHLQPALRALAAFGIVSAAIAAPHYIRLFLALAGSSGSIWSVVVGQAGSQEKEAIAQIVHESFRETTTHSIAWWFHTALWGDPTGVFMPSDMSPHPLAPFVFSVWASGLLVLLVAVAGLIGLFVKRRDVLRAAGAALLFGAVYTVFLLNAAVSYPYFILPKTTFMLPDALPGGIVLGVGLGMVHARARTLLRVLLLVVASGGIVMTTYGWWLDAPRDRRPLAPAVATSGPAVTVERYFRDRVTNPLRTIRLFGAEAQLERGLTAVGVLGIPPLPREVGLSADDEYSLELARARVAWLTLYNLIRWMQPIAGALAVEVVAADERGDSANVRVRIAAVAPSPPAGGDIGLWPFPPFEQHFELQRRDGAWRITRITQTNVVAENAVQAFVAAPSQAGLDGLLALGWKPPWQNAIASGLRRRQ